MLATVQLAADAIHAAPNRYERLCRDAEVKQHTRTLGTIIVIYLLISIGRIGARSNAKRNGSWQ